MKTFLRVKETLFNVAVGLKQTEENMRKLFAVSVVSGSEARRENDDDIRHVAQIKLFQPFSGCRALGVEFDTYLKQNILIFPISPTPQNQLNPQNHERARSP